MSFLTYTQGIGLRLPRWRRPRVGWLAVPALLLFGAVTLASYLFVPAEAHSVPSHQWRGLQEGGAREQIVLVRSNQQWVALWRNLGRPSPASLDLGKQTAVYVGLGNRPSAGYSARLVSTTAHDDRLFIVWEEVTPPPGRMTAQVVTQPWLVIVVDRADLVPVIEQRIR